MRAKENCLKKTKGQIAKANEIDIWYETCGDEKNKPLLLIMGGCCRLAPSKIQTPTVILHGSEDPIFPPDHGYALSKEIKNSEYIPVEGMGHIPSDQFYDLYIKILKQQSMP